MFRLAFIIPLWLFLFQCVSFAQRETATDTVSVSAGERADTAFVMQKSPLGAVLRSAILPGWGQFYNESYWKIPVILGVSGYLIYGVLSEHNNFIEYRDKYDASITSSNPSGNLRYKQFREFYRDRRDTYAWWFAVAYLIQIADAFVDAHLYDFDVSEDLQASLSVSPSGRFSLQLRW